jgi:TolB protein
MTRLLLAVAVAALAAAAAATAPVPAAKKPQWLIVSARTGSANIFLHTEGDADPVNLTDDQSNNSYPAWSPDGKRIAFCSDRDGAYHVFVMDADGKNVKQLTKGDLACRVPSWTADGKTIAFCRYTAAGSSEVCTVPAAGGDPTPVDCGGDAWDPVFSPDGKRIAFVSYRDGNGFRLYVMDADGKNVTKLTDDGNPIGFGYPAWSPDGKTIAYGHGDGNGVDVYTVGADGKDRKQLTKLGGVTTYPCWSADGKRIAFFSQTGAEKGAFHLMDADGGNVKELLKDEAHVEGGRPAWRPK